MRREFSRGERGSASGIILLTCVRIASLLGGVYALHIDNLAAKGAEHLLDHRVLFGGFAQALFIQELFAPIGLFL
jgi:hypothetical protein